MDSSPNAKKSHNSRFKINDKKFPYRDYFFEYKNFKHMIFQWILNKIVITVTFVIM